jgi:hypothetical protein
MDLVLDYSLLLVDIIDEAGSCGFRRFFVCSEFNEPWEPQSKSLLSLPEVGSACCVDG